MTKDAPNTISSVAPNSILSAAPDEQTEGPHLGGSARTPIEPNSGNKNKLVIAGIVAFLVFLALIYGLISFGKMKVKEFNDGQEQKQAEKKAKSVESPSTRKAISFADVFANKEKEKEKEGTKKAGTSATASGVAPIPLKDQNADPKATSAATAVIRPSHPSMMADLNDASGVPARSTGVGQTSASGASTQQAYVRPEPPKRLTPEEIIAMVQKVQAGTGAAGGTKAASVGTGASADTSAPARNVQEVAERSRNRNLTNTAQVSAANLGDTRYVITRGHHLPCVLETEIMSNLPGSTACILTENIWSTDRKTILLEKGSRAVGEYKNGLKNGDTRLAIIWNRLETPTGVVIDAESPTADMVGAAGVDGYVDNHWPQRIGAAMLLSFIQDAIQYETVKAQPINGSVGNYNPTYSNSTGTGGKLAEKILDSTINIPPTLIKHRGDLVTIEVRHDLWFQDVYRVK